MSASKQRGTAWDADLDCVRSWSSQPVGLDDVAAAVVRLWQGQAWQACGYESWPAMFAGEVGKPLQLGRRNRGRLHERLGAAGMSTRAIAVVTGVAHRTVSSDGKAETADCAVIAQSAVSAPQPSPEPPAPAPQVGLDGAVRVTGAASAKLTADIVALREGPVRLTWPQIGEAVGCTWNAARLRYANYLESKPVDAPPPPVHLPTPARIAALAETGMTSKQIAADLGIGVTQVRRLADRDGVRIVGDINRGRGGSKSIDMPAAVTNWITQVNAALDAGDAFIDLADEDPWRVGEWACQLDEIARRFRALTRKFQQQSHPTDRQAQHG